MTDFGAYKNNQFLQKIVDKTVSYNIQEKPNLLFCRNTDVLAKQNKIQIGQLNNIISGVVELYETIWENGIYQRRILETTIKEALNSVGTSSTSGTPTVDNTKLQVYFDNIKDSINGYINHTEEKFLDFTQHLNNIIREFESVRKELDKFANKLIDHINIKENTKLIRDHRIEKSLELIHTDLEIIKLIPDLIKQAKEETDKKDSENLATILEELKDTITKNSLKAETIRDKLSEDYNKINDTNKIKLDALAFALNKVLKRLENIKQESEHTPIEIEKEIVKETTDECCIEIKELIKFTSTISREQDELIKQLVYQQTERLAEIISQKLDKAEGLDTKIEVIKSLVENLEITGNPSSEGKSIDSNKFITYG